MKTIQLKSINPISSFFSFYFCSFSLNFSSPAVLLVALSSVLVLVQLGRLDKHRAEPRLSEAAQQEASSRLLRPGGPTVCSEAACLPRRSHFLPRGRPASRVHLGCRRSRRPWPSLRSHGAQPSARLSGGAREVAR